MILFVAHIDPILLDLGDPLALASEYLRLLGSVTVIFNINSHSS